MESFRQTSTRVLQTLLALQPATLAKVTFAWHIAAGPALARAASVDWTENGTLRVKAKSAEWAREIRNGKPMILERLRQLLGPDVVNAIVLEASQTGHALVTNHKSQIANHK